MAKNSPMRLVQVSDTHLSEDRAWFVDNWDVFVDEMQADPPDLIVWSGDVSLRGTHSESDLAFARKEMKRLPCPTLVIPGNHDIGEPNPLGPGKPFPNPEREKPVNTARLRKWRNYFGADWWTEDFGDWRLYGLNSQIIGSGLKAEAQQLSDFKTALQGAGGRPGPGRRFGPPALLPDRPI
jgi:3',5'-cyclic AMP phosphodiesterase CpdA